MLRHIPGHLMMWDISDQERCWEQKQTMVGQLACLDPMMALVREDLQEDLQPVQLLQHYIHFHGTLAQPEHSAKLQELQGSQIAPQAN